MPTSTVRVTARGTLIRRPPRRRAARARRRPGSRTGTASRCPSRQVVRLDVAELVRDEDADAPAVSRSSAVSQITIRVRRADPEELGVQRAARRLASFTSTSTSPTPCSRASPRISAASARSVSGSTRGSSRYGCARTKADADDDEGRAADEPPAVAEPPGEQHDDHGGRRATIAADPSSSHGRPGSSRSRRRDVVPAPPPVRGEHERQAGQPDRERRPPARRAAPPGRRSRPRTRGEAERDEADGELDQRREHPVHARNRACCSLRSRYSAEPEAASSIHVWKRRRPEQPSARAARQRRARGRRPRRSPATPACASPSSPTSTRTFTRSRRCWRRSTAIRPTRSGAWATPWATGRGRTSAASSSVRGARTLVGNHDLVALGSAARRTRGLQPRGGAAASVWTSRRSSTDDARFLSSLEPAATLDGFELYHGSPRDPGLGLRPRRVRSPTSFTRSEAPIVLVGHSHVATGAVLPAETIEGGVAPADFSAPRRRRAGC